ncbi:MAG: hypothetical protein RLZZ244_2756 [Verrucomicrobiota bacterium]|jgi:hypothetical protein
MIHPMRRPLLWALPFLVSLAPVGFAADSESLAKNAAPTPAKSASGAPSEGNAEPSGSLLGRIFGKGKESSKSPASDTKSPSGSKKSGGSSNPPQAVPVPAAPASAPGDSKPSLPSSSASSKKSASKEKSAPAEAPKTEDERFQLLMKTASEDPKVVELRAKADSATDNAEADRLTRAYLRTLYGKMRTLDPQLKDRINLTEAAALRIVPESHKK